MAAHRNTAGETTKENSAYIIRLADVYLYSQRRRWGLDAGIDDLNTVREARA